MHEATPLPGHPDRLPQLERQFRQAFSAAPGLVAAAPGRINLIGEHTDYNEGFVLPASIDRVALCALRPNGLDRYRLLAVDLDETAEVSLDALAPQPQQWANYLLGVVAALRARGHEVPGFDCALTCDVPIGKGLSSSAAIECALAVGLDDLLGLGLDDWSLVRVGQAAENDFVGARTGLLDQFASIFGRADAALLLDCRSLAVELVPLRLPGHAFVVLDTGVKHNHLTSGYADRRADCERAVAQLQAGGWPGESLRDATVADLTAFAKTLDARTARRARFVVEENARVLRAVDQLRQGDVVGFGESLLDGHWGLSELYDVSCPESDALVRHLEADARVRGARQMGGGFGGCVLAVVETSAVDDVIDDAQQEYFEQFGIALEALDVAVGPGASVVWRAGQRDTLPSPEPQFRLAPKPESTASQLPHTPHRRLNLLTGEWVLVSPHRSQRPWQGQVEDLPTDTRPRYDPSCYLCPGNERAGGERNPAYASTYSFENDFAALVPPDGAPSESYQEGLLVAEPEAGVCRVLCFSSDHAETLADMSIAEIAAVVVLWREQYAELGALPYVNYVQIFENKGALMGCSNPHPHGQVWAQQTIPEIVLRKGEHQRVYFESKEGESLLSAYLEQEIAAEVRTVYVDEHFVALVPWWAVWPFEVMIAPRRPMAHLGELREGEVTAFANAIREVTSRYDQLFHVSFPYSSGIHQAPTDGGDHTHWHWHMEFKPPLLRSASVRKFMVGYELFAMPQRDITPEAAAGRLREVG